jgi:hypothetical protein
MSKVRRFSVWRTKRRPASVPCTHHEPLPLQSLWAAYEFARVQAVTALRKEAGGKLDLERIQQHIDGIAAWVPRLGEIVTKASTVQNSGKAIEATAKDIKEDIETRVAKILALLRLDAE